VATHTIGDHTQVVRIVERPAVFVNRPDATLVRHTERAQHPSVIGTSGHLIIWSSGHLVIVAELSNRAIEKR
jgi:hypothetical protein